MEKIEFFRPRYIEQDGSMSVGFWMCENKKVDDGYFYRAADVDALLAVARALVEATMEWHSVDDCHAEGRSDCRLCKAIAAVERHFSSKTSQP